ncbi:uncharacterized protein [Triticum aestivum]|uniref:uncharacterized protein n=1 Tax=Triticum aestivum TaxID=4565 RepID=UPI001D03472F|nr:uncharacterized protein LOC123159849 [Triticum aestivum]
MAVRSLAPLGATRRAQGGGRRAPRPAATGAARHGSGPRRRGAGSRLLARAAAAAEASMESPTPKSPYEFEPTNELALAHIPTLARKESCIREGCIILVLQSEGINKN